MGSSDEFPLLKTHKLYAADIRGDGNCLFNALSDQLYGHQNEHDAIRARVIEYMREHAAYYKQFVDVHPGGGIRRRPKRKVTAAAFGPADVTPPSAEDINRAFENHLSSMARGGTFGDNMEISAFAAAFKYDVKIYQADFAYMVAASDDGADRPVAHIAYHMWEHYSSIRNLDGPHTGPPLVHEVALTPEENAENEAAAAKVTRVQPWQINVVISSLPYLADRDTIRKTLEEYKGNVNDAVSALLDAEERASVSSQNGSSSTERDPDSDDEQFSGPSKKQDRRMSRATKSLKAKAEKERAAKEAAAKGRTAAAKEEPIEVSEPLSPNTALPVRQSIEIAPKTLRNLKKEENEDVKAWTGVNDEDSDYHPLPSEADDDAGSEYSTPSASQEPPPTKPTIKITLNHSNAGKTSQKQAGPQKRHLVSARQLKEQKKLAQKAARKERAKTEAKKHLDTTSTTSSSNLKSMDARPHDLGMGIKTLYI